MRDTDPAAVIDAARAVAEEGFGDVPRLAQAVELLAHCHLRSGAELAALAALVEAVIARVDAAEARQAAPVVPIARGPLDFTPPADITLATVVPDNADRAWWKSRVAPLTPEEEGR